MRSIANAIGACLCVFALSVIIFGYTLYIFGDRIQITDPQACKNSETLAEATAKMNLKWYQYTYCEDMEDKLSIGCS
jgi:hypothetical protein